MRFRKSISIAVSALDRPSTDNTRIFGNVNQVHNGSSYDIQIKYGVLDCNFPNFKLMPLPSIIDVVILIPALDWRITLHVAAAAESTTDKVLIFCKCKDKCSWCSTRRFACFYAEVKCGITCHGRVVTGGTDCPNVAASTLHSQKRLRVRDRNEKGELQHKKTTEGGKK